MFTLALPSLVDDDPSSWILSSLAMCTRRFLLGGICTSAAFAGIALVATWLVVRASHTAGVVAYPTVWYAVIHREQNYSIGNTFCLIAYTYAGSCLLAMLIVAVVMAPRVTAQEAFAQGAYGQTVIKLFYPLAVIPFAAVFAIPYATVFTPIAFLHRLLMLRLFARPRTEPTAPDPPRM
jgi:hypothetical protein